MPLHLVAPGKRKGNEFFLIRGTINGRRYEVSSKTRDHAAALEFKARFELAVLQSRVPQPGEAVSFSRAVELYSAWRDPRAVDRARLAKLVATIGERMVAELRHADLVEAANRLYPGRVAATKNREALRPAASVLHYAANQGWCGWLRVALFKEPRAKTRSVDQDVARILINSMPELPRIYKHKRTERYLAKMRAKQKKKKLLLLWLFRQGPRISDALKIKSDQIDMKRRIVKLHIGKGDEYLEEPLSDEVFEFLANDPPASGRLFPWHSRSGVYAWLTPYAKSLGIKFTPHMARHSLGKWLNEDRASLRQIMDTLHHADPKSSIRYQSTDIEVIRAAGRRLGRLTPAKKRR